MKTSITDKEMLIRTLMSRMGLKRNQIEVHDRAQRIINHYHPDEVFVGNVVVRQENTGIRSDIGWELTKDGTYAAHLDSYDYQAKTRYDDVWANSIQDTYNLEVCKQGLVDKGRSFTEKLVDGFPVIEFEMPEEENGETLQAF
jgi:hypothetical protein